MSDQAQAADQNQARTLMSVAAWFGAIGMILMMIGSWAAFGWPGPVMTMGGAMVATSIAWEALARRIQGSGNER